MIYGYCRVSTKTQELERQERNILRAYPDAKLFSEKFTGTKLTERTEMQKLLKIVKAEDTIIFDSVSRMSRNAKDGFELYQKLYNKGIELVFLKEPHINTETYKKALETNLALTGTNVDYIIKGINQYLMALAQEQIQIAFDQSQKEVDDIHTRTSEGMWVKGASGTKENPNDNSKSGDGIGSISKARTGITYETKKSKETKQKILKLSKSFGGNCSDVELLELLNISRNSLYKYKRELKGDAE